MALTSVGESKAQLYSLLDKFDHGLIADYVAFQAEHPEVLTEFGIDQEHALGSMRLLSLCSACNKASNGRLSYEDAAKAMGLECSTEELSIHVEEWVPFAIKR